MKKTSPKIVFFGSGPVAAQSLLLLQKHCEVEAVITKTSTLEEMKAVVPSGSVLTADSKTELDALVTSESFSSSLGILIDFGIIVSRIVIDSFEHGIINSHFSLLPEWRGADPISFSVLSGQSKTGVSLMMIDEGMDTGKILTQKSIPVEASDTTPTLTKKLITLSDNLLSEYIPGYLSGSVKPRQQPHPDRATYSRKLTKQDGVLDFNKPAQQLEREIRAFIDWPKSRTELASKDVVILSASVDEAKSGTPGTIYKTADKKIGIHTPQGGLVINLLKPAGKQAMTTEAFLAGYGSRL